MSLADQVATKLFTARTLIDAGVIRTTRPDRLLKAGRALAKWGPTPAAGYAASAARYPDEVGLVDERGTLSFARIHERTNALANALRARGIAPGDGVAIMARNHRGFVEATVACSKLGANALYLNTAFAGPQITDVCRREAPAAVVYDEEFAALCAGALEGRRGVVAWSDTNATGDPSLDALIAEGDTSELPAPAEKGRVVILTSGTTGTPKGASRKQPESLDPAAALLAKIPLRAREKTHIAAPMFHSWGFAHFTLGMSLSSTLVLTRRFDPEGMLRTLHDHRCTALVVVPVMLQRAMELPEETVSRYDLAALRVIAASGSALPGELASRVMDRFGDVLYNLYGSTEVAWATVATPQDMRAAPGTAGRPPRGTVVRLYDDQGVEVPAGATGRIFVGNEMAFEGYTGGGGKAAIDGLLSSGDVGHFDADGRLFVDGRDDEMIVSGGENVFPREVEDLLSDHPAIEEAAVLGVPDAEFGERLQAHVVLRPGHELDEDGVKAYVKDHLARYKVPREVLFLPELPRNSTGKILKRELLDSGT
ncbi:MAG: Long-chain-fatty-acid--CoA ligase [uncultured Solirubrobacteraceae bacterium]|uniref:Long-chain-fatty-acid--CoA ligase n=1 Tax=uncultured Solirubrobacteraceae bacterium TaxID=1162706 RepID=A0A6J4SLL6_9ACTN|nr:MAG: Long-chain-fatty-acid--CoA ligase [uncultured Solirubrobacteraceae bacterium]